MESLSLRGRVALVTGASRGLGRAIALALAEAGADLALASRSRESLEAVAAEIRSFGRRSEIIAADVSNLRDIDRMVEQTLEDFERIDVLANVAGVNVRKPALEISEAEWDNLVTTNLKGAFFACKAVAPAMIRQGKGKIINIASLTSVIGIKNVSAYGATKGGVAQLTRALAVEWAKYNIAVNAIGPGYYRTQMTAPVFEDPELLQWVEGRIPMGRTGVPSDLAGAAVFLASDASDYVTGQVIYVDGGFLAG